MIALRIFQRAICTPKSQMIRHLFENHLLKKKKKTIAWRFFPRSQWQFLDVHYFQTHPNIIFVVMSSMISESFPNHTSIMYHLSPWYPRGCGAISSNKPRTPAALGITTALGAFFDDFEDLHGASTHGLGRTKAWNLESLGIQQLRVSVNG